MKRITIVTGAVSVLLLSACGGDVETETNLDAIDTSTPDVQQVGEDFTGSDWRLVWNDEFDGTTINTSNWNYEVNCDGGGNQEFQCYTDSEENAFVSDGTLKIVSKLTEGASGEDDDFTSARLTTQNKADFKYGRIVMRAKLPMGQGSWPAFWMMPTDSVYGGWPKSGEIDIMEAVNLGAMRSDGTPETNVYGTIHYGGGPASDFSGASYTPETSPASDFNTYAIEWQEGEIRWYFNDTLFATQRQSELNVSSTGEVVGLNHRGWYAELYNIATGELENNYSPAPFDQDFFLILNSAVGGNWPASVNETGIDVSAFEGAGQTYEIDFVRVYQCTADPDTGRGCETISPGYETDVADGGFLVEGQAPSPSLAAGEANPITIFDDVIDPNWVAWDCCGGSTPGLVEDDEDRGNVYEFEVQNGNNGTVFGFITRAAFLPQDPTSGSSPTPHNALGMIESGYVTVDVKVMSAPLNPDSQWLFKIEADEGSGGEWEVPLANFGPEPIVGEWATYQVPLQDIADAGVDLTLLDVIMVFPAWQTGDGAVFRMDNVAIESGEEASGPMFAEFTEGFGGASIDGTTYSFPVGSEVWGGFANTNTNLYPLNFVNGGTLTFTASIPDGANDTSIRFVFENAPFPDVDPNFATANIDIVGNQARTYTVNIPPQDAENTYSSFLLYINEAGNSVNIQDVKVVANNHARMEGFGNVSFDAATSTYTFPANAEVWGGFANTNTDLYPLTFERGGKVTFTGSIPSGESDVTVNFRFEKAAFPDVDPAFSTDNVVVSGLTEQTYTVYIPPQDAENTYSSFLLYLVDRDSPVIIKNIVVSQNENVATWEGFGNATIDADTGEFNFPSNAEVWAGFANTNSSAYPLNFAAGGRVEFSAALPGGGSDTNVRFLFEKNPFPDVDPNFGVGPVTVTSTTMTRYVVEIPPQPAENTFSSFLLYLNENDSPVIIKDVVVTADRPQ
ncbi:glycoside hydrolase family 16 protein [Glaciecola sp. MH2013]|uniref:glycoside hydrolase family 16 protein n=1 Tax=Glaciecola sp. MH2013 TaxID=2785524 RepID=UPI00189EBC74|nr:glycoside hydrolase family 16 protein [Glaciecola sp. MH2013]MBF7074232.1 glycoside hydrolase family 16 protein [Glaciecola sp. MH2013]